MLSRCDFEVTTLSKLKPGDFFLYEYGGATSFGMAAVFRPDTLDVDNETMVAFEHPSSDPKGPGLLSFSVVESSSKVIRWDGAVMTPDLTTLTRSGDLPFGALVINADKSLALAAESNHRVANLFNVENGRDIGPPRGQYFWFREWKIVITDTDNQQTTLFRFKATA